MTSIDEIVRELSGLMEKAKRQWPERWELVRDGAYADIRRVGTPYNITTDMPRHQAALAVAVENHLPALLPALSRSRRMEEALQWIVEDGASDSRAVECARAALEDT